MWYFHSHTHGKVWPTLSFLILIRKILILSHSPFPQLHPSSSHFLFHGPNTFSLHLLPTTVTMNAVFCFSSSTSSKPFTHIFGLEQPTTSSHCRNLCLVVSGSGSYWYWYGLSLNPICKKEEEEHEDSVWCVWESPCNRDLLRRWGSFVCQMWRWSSCCKQACKQAPEASPSMSIKQASQMWHMPSTPFTLCPSSSFFFF